MRLLLIAAAFAVCGGGASYVYGASITGTVRLEVPKDIELKTTRRKTNASKQIVITVNKDTKVEVVVEQPLPPPPSRLFYTDYSAVWDFMTVRPVWQSENEPRAPGEGEIWSPASKEQTDRIRVVPAPDGPRKPVGPVMRVELRPYKNDAGVYGDVQVSGDGYTSSRAEVYARHAVPGNTPAAQWPDPVDSTRWYGISVFVPADFQTSDRNLWFIFTQWKGYQTGSPPISLEITRDQFTIGPGNRYQLGGLGKGSWTNFVVGIHFSPDPTKGWINAYKNGVEVVPQTPRATMLTKTVNRVVVVDPNYLKQGIYRTQDWRVTHVLYFGPTTIGTSKESVAEYLK